MVKDGSKITQFFPMQHDITALFLPPHASNFAMSIKITTALL